MSGRSGREVPLAVPAVSRLGPTLAGLAAVGWRVVVFAGVPALLLGMWLSVRAAEHLRSRQRHQFEELASVLEGTAVRGHPRRRYEDQITRWSETCRRWPLLVRRLANLETREQGALSIYLFDADGRLVRLPGRPARPRTAAERFLRAVKRADHPVSRSLLATFAGNEHAPTMVRQAPGLLVDLLNGEERTWCGWWSLRLPSPRPRRSAKSGIAGGDERPRAGNPPRSTGGAAGDLIVFVHRGAIDPNRLMDRAVRETRRLVGHLFEVGWQHPTHLRQLRPANLPFPAHLAATLASFTVGQIRHTDRDRELVRLCTENGELLFATGAWPFAADASALSGAQVPWLCFLLGALALLLTTDLTTGTARCGLRGKLAAWFLLAGGVPLGLLVITGLIDRADREATLIETTRTRQLEHLQRIDSGFHASLQRRMREYRHLADAVSTLPPSRQPAVLERACRRLIAQGRGEIHRILAADAAGRLWFELLPDDDISGTNGPGNLARPGDLARRAPDSSTGFFVDLTHKNLKRWRGERVIDSKAYLDPRNLTSALSRVFSAGRIHGSSEEADRLPIVTLPGQSFISYQAPLGRPLPRTADEETRRQAWRRRFRGAAAILHALHDGRPAQRVFLEDLVRRWPYRDALQPRLVALPANPGLDLPPFPAAASARNLELRRLQQLVLTSRQPQHRLVVFADRTYLLSGALGHHLDEYVLILAQPWDPVLADIAALDRRLAVLAVLVIGLAAGLGALSSWLLLRPLAHLQLGLAALARREFRHYPRPTASAVTEFDRLGQRFALVMDDLADLEVARTVQESLWPGEGLHGDGWQLAGRCVTASDLGGDLHDWLVIDPRRVVFAVADVAGHGIPASLVTAAAKIELTLAAEQVEQPAAMLTRMNAGFHRQAGRIRPISMWLAVFDPAARTLRFASAGHPYAIALCPGEEPRLLGQAGYPLGARRHATYAEGAIDLPPGATVVAYSDGLPEACDRQGHPLGYERFIALVADLAATARPAIPTAALAGHPGRHHPMTPSAGPIPATRAVDAILTAVQAWSGRVPPEDDQTCVILAVSDHPGHPADQPSDRASRPAAINRPPDRVAAPEPDTAAPDAARPHRVPPAQSCGDNR